MKYYVTSRLSENIHETPEGYLLCVGVPIARTGEMIYGEGETPLEARNGKVIISREEKEVFRPETMASFEGKAVTIMHPAEFVSPDNWSQLAKGIIQNVRRGDGDNKDDLIADLLVTDSRAIELVKGGLREVSCGYEAEYTQTGEGQGIQTHIIGNHLALVDQGRAGSSYAINDHKGKGVKMTIKERIKTAFARAQDEALKTVDADEFEKEKKDEPKAKDEAKAKEDEKAKSKDAMAYDELMKAVKDLADKVTALNPKAKDDASSTGSNSQPAQIEAKDEPEAPASLEDRLAKLEAMVLKLMEREAKEDEVSVDNEDENTFGEEEESEDAEMPGEMVTTDTASRVEILSPGMKITKDAKKKALEASYATADGKKVIDSLTGGKAPKLDSPEMINTLFIATSELLKTSRSESFSRTKIQTQDFSGAEKKGVMTAEAMNKINAEHYANRH